MCMSTVLVYEQYVAIKMHLTDRFCGEKPIQDTYTMQHTMLELAS